MNDKAVVLPITECNVSVTVGHDGVWMHFSTSIGLSRSIHVINCLYSKHIRQWCIERCEQANVIEAEGGQFGMGD